MLPIQKDKHFYSRTRQCMWNTHQINSRNCLGPMRNRQVVQLSRDCRTAAEYALVGGGVTSKSYPFGRTYKLTCCLCRLQHPVKPSIGIHLSLVIWRNPFKACHGLVTYLSLAQTPYLSVERECLLILKACQSMVVNLDCVLTLINRQRGCAGGDPQSRSGWNSSKAPWKLRCGAEQCANTNRATSNH